MAQKIQDIQLLSLYVGGRDGGIVVAASTATTAKVIHMIQCLEDDTEFTVLAGVEQDGTTARNLITGNGYSGIKWAKVSLHFAPFGGKISSFTADKAVRYFRMADTGRTQND